MIEEFIVDGRLFDVIVALLVWRLFHNMKVQPNNGNISKELKRLQAEIETSYVEMWDYLEQTMKPIRSRLETRMRREKKRGIEESEDLKEEESKKKGGLMTPSQYKKYGIDR